ncbi:MAG: GGDEF domain-containing protein [Candidatus Rokubacteria bacterium]|nr:GGDEF domain-containing protein [Betaproteobacteria bacterium]MBM4441086.1 GGDEF domain-containing protein [Candidatus Rokubacteria bacterium]
MSGILFVERWGTGARVLAAFVFFALVAAVGAALPHYLSLTPLYLVVVLFAVWNLGLAWGGVFLVAALAVSTANGLVFGHPFLSQEWFYYDMASRFFVYVLVLLVAGAARAAYGREQKRARSDSLTGLANRAALYERIEIEIERQKRNGGPMALAYTDCDDFKRINDRHGHAAGDRLLRSVAQTLAGSVRKTDLVARVGGDEFAVLLPETAEHEATLVIEKLHRRLGQLPEVSAGTIGFSIGVAVARAAPESAAWLVDQADHLMFEVKRSGKNAVRQRVVVEEGERAHAGGQRAEVRALRAAGRAEAAASRGPSAERKGF